MNEHDELWERLPLAAAGGLGSTEERRLRAHLDGCARCAAELEAIQQLTSALRALPTPQPPPALVARVRRQVDLELARRSDERLNQWILVFLLIFSWTVTWLGFVFVRILSGHPLEWWGILSTTGLGWSLAYFVVAWMGGAAAAVLLGVHHRRSRRFA